MAMRPGATPVPIPNTTVKPRAADGTMPATAWESRRLPEHLNHWFRPVIRVLKSSILMTGRYEAVKQALHLENYIPKKIS